MFADCRASACYTVNIFNACEWLLKNFAKQKKTKLFVMDNLKILPPSQKEFELIVETIKKANLSTFDLKIDGFLLAKKNNEIIGFVRDHKIGKISAISSLFIFPKFRKQGFAKKLIFTVIENSSDNIFYLDCLKKIKDMYLKLGFEEIKNPPEVLWQKYRWILEKEFNKIFSKKLVKEKLSFFKFQKTVNSQELR